MTTTFERRYERRDTAANWASANPVLASGEWGYDSTNKIAKIGDGTTAWNSLPVGNSGVVDRVLFGAGQLGPIATGDPAGYGLMDSPDGRLACWQLVDGSASGAQTPMVWLPSHWTTFSVTIHWVSNDPAASGNIVVRNDYSFLKEGDNVNDTPPYVVGASNVLAVATQYILQTDNLGNVTNDPTRMFMASPLRIGQSGSDTCSTTVQLAAVQLDRVT